MCLAHLFGIERIYAGMIIVYIYSALLIEKSVISEQGHVTASQAP